MTTQTIEKRNLRGVPVRRDALVGAVAGVAGFAAWLLWAPVVGIDLVVRSGSGTQTVGAAAVVTTLLVVTVAGIGLLRVLEARTTNGLRTWTIIAWCVLAISLLGPLGATTAEAGLALTSMHLAVAAVLVTGLRLAHRENGSSGVA